MRLPVPAYDALCISPIATYTGCVLMMNMWSSRRGHRCSVNLRRDGRVHSVAVERRRCYVADTWLDCDTLIISSSHHALMFTDNNVTEQPLQLHLSRQFDYPSRHQINRKILYWKLLRRVLDDPKHFVALIRSIPTTIFGASFNWTVFERSIP